MRIPSAALALVVAALLAACGGGGGDRLTKAEYIVQADAICKQADGEIAALGDPKTLAELAELADRAVAIGRAELSKLRALKPPRADEATLDQAYDLIGRQLDLAGQIAAAARAGDQAKIQALVEQGNPIGREARKIATDYGLKQCGSGG
jgi:hypothetical protein